MNNTKKALAALLLLALLTSYPAYKAFKPSSGPGPTMSLMSSGSIESGQIITGHITGAPSPSTDTYTFEVDAGDSFLVSIAEVGTPTAFKPWLKLIRPNGSSGGAIITILYDQLQTYSAAGGTWTFEVTRHDGTAVGGDYELTVIKVPGTSSVSGGNAGGVMYPNTSYAGSIYRGDVDLYTFKASSNNPILTLSATGGTGFKPLAQTYTPTGSNKGAVTTTTTATLNLGTVTSGSIYTIAVYKTDANDVVGTYTLSISAASLPTYAKADGANCFDCSVGGVAVGDPMNVATGNLYEEVTDYTTAGTNPLALTRYYNSQSYTRNIYPAIFGVNWRSNFDRYLRVLSGSQAVAERADGQAINFTSSGTWTPDSDTDYRLTSSGSTYTLIDSNDTTETYTVTSGKGRLDSIALRNGYSQSLSYTSTGNLSSVTDSYGRSLALTFTSGAVSYVTTPDNLTLTYGYTQPSGSNNRLETVTYNTSPTTSLTYLYETAELPYMLTGITDENGNRFATWTYDGSGRATSSTHAGSAGLTSISYSSAGNLVTGPLGIQDTYKFTTLQSTPKLSRIDRAANGTVAAATRLFTYDSNGYLNTQTDWNGVQTAYTNNSRGDPTAIVFASGTANQYTTSISYDATWVRLPATITNPGVTGSFTYSSTGGNMLTSTLTDTTSHSVPYSTNGQTRTNTFTYTSTGLLSTATSPRTDLTSTTTYAYTGGTLYTITDPVSLVTTINTAQGGGLPLTITDPNSNVTTLAYNNRNWLTSSSLAVSGGSLTSTIQYDSAGNLTKSTLPDASYLSYGYDNAHRLTTVTNRLSETQNFTLDDMGNITQALWKDSGATTKRQTTATFDALGRMLTSVGGMSQSTAFTYDDQGNVLTVTDPLTNVTTMTYDDLNRVLTVTDAATNETEYTYDLLGRVLTVTDPRGKVTSYVYNGFGDVIQEASPDRGTWVWYYDKARNVTQQIDGNSVTTNMTYDAADRILTRTYPADSSLNVAYTYDQGGHGEGIGRLTSVTDQAGTLSLDYDERGLVTSQDRVISGNTYTTDFTYESAGRYSSVTYPDAGWVINYARDNAGQISAVTAKEPGQSPVNVATSVTYLPFGPVKSFTYGNSVANTRTFDLDYRMTSAKDQGSGTIYYTSNTWNANNNLTNIVDNVSNTNNQDLTYDVIDRLTYASSGSYTSSSITYDSNSNRLTYGATNYTISGTSNRMTVAGGTSITYTSAGNISAIGSNTMAYNKANQLATATVSGTASTYVYDAFGQRLKSTVGAGTPVIQQYGMGGALLSETQGAAETNYVYLNGMPIAAINTASPAISYIHTNHLGTPQKATNSGQSVVWSGAYQPFGAVTPTTSITQNLRFPGQYADPTGFNYNMFRNYNPTLGRYLESDPIGLAGGINPYVYANSNPYSYIDPLGLDIAIITGRQRVDSPNIMGHSSVAVTGGGVHSFGTETPRGSSAADFVKDQAQYRDQTITIIETTSEQDAAALDYLNSKPDKIGKAFDNCASRTKGAAEAAGAELKDPATFGMTPPPPTPGNVKASAEAYPGSQTINVPKGGIAPDMSQFEPQPKSQSQPPQSQPPKAQPQSSKP